MITPRLPDDQCILINDGGLGSLVMTALLAQSTPKNSDHASVIYPAWWNASDELESFIPAIDRALQRYADVFGFELITDRAGYPSPEADFVRHPEQIGPHQTRVLLDACALALERNIRTIAWPIQIPDHDEDRLAGIATAIDRALLSARLSTLDAPAHDAVEVVIVTPIVDLREHQILDLAADLSVPFEAGWWQGSEHPIAVAESERWAAPVGAPAPE